MLISVSQDILPFCVVAVIVVVAFELSFYFFSWLRTADSNDCPESPPLRAWKRRASALAIVPLGVGPVPRRSCKACEFDCAGAELLRVRSKLGVCSATAGKGKSTRCLGLLPCRLT